MAINKLDGIFYTVMVPKKNKHRRIAACSLIGLGNPVVKIHSFFQQGLAWTSGFILFNNYIMCRLFNSSPLTYEPERN